MHEKVLDAFVTKGHDSSTVLNGEDVFIGPVQSVRLESQGPEHPADPLPGLIVYNPPYNKFVIPYGLDRSRLRAIITDDATDWIMPGNQVLLRYGKKVLEQTGTPGKHWNRVTNGKGLKCLWNDLQIGDVIRVGTSQTEGYSDFMTITDIKEVDEIHNGTDSPIPMFTAECIYALYGDKPHLANYGLTDIENTNSENYHNGHGGYYYGLKNLIATQGDILMQGNGSLQSNWDYTNWSQRGEWGTSSRPDSHDTYDDVDGQGGKTELPKQQFWLSTRAEMHAAAVVDAQTGYAGTHVDHVTSDDRVAAYQQALRDLEVKSYITREQFSTEAYDKANALDFAQTQGLPGSDEMGWDEVRIGKDAHTKITRADGEQVLSGRGLPSDSAAFKCFRVSAYVNCTSMGNLPSPSTYFSTVDPTSSVTDLEAFSGYGQTGDVTLPAAHPLYPKTHCFMAPSDSEFRLASLAERYTAHLYRDSIVQAPKQGECVLSHEINPYLHTATYGEHIDAHTTVDPLNRWQKYKYPLFKASSFIDGEAQLKLTLKSDVKAITKITLVGFNLLGQSRNGFQMQHKYRNQATDFVVLRIKEVEGGVISNNPNIHGAFAVLPNKALTNYDDGSYESSMYESEKGVASLDMAEGQRGVRFLTFELKDRFGNDVVMTGRVQLWLRLHCLCG